MKSLRKELKRKILDAMRKGRIEQRDGVYRFSENIGGIARGTVVIGKRIIYGYPKIQRIFALAEGAKRNLKPGKVWVEEKIDGFNLRVAFEGGKVLAVSRGGFLDFFATEKVSDDPAIKRFFGEHPDSVLYMEMVGNTPYTEPTKKFDVNYYVFDVGNGKNRFIGPEERGKLCKKYGLNCVPLLGKVDHGEAGKLKKIAASLDKRGGEGIVLKQHLPRRVVKYVVPSSEVRDLAESSHMIFDMPVGFMKQRVFRSALSVSELGLDKKEYARKLGEALHKNLSPALRKGGEVGSSFEVLVKRRRTWKKVLEHMSSEVGINVDSEENVKGGIRIKFRKIHKKGSRKLRRAVEGYAQVD